MNSGFGRPFPRHGLQLLFWFANHCVSCELINSVVIMKLVSDCQPEKGVYGFHQFGNIEELLPVLNRSKKRKRQATYFEVGNLNIETYPASANLPTYVRENYEVRGNHGNYNTDRIIISYQVRTRVVETVYVTEHDGGGTGRFSPDRTHEIGFELIQVLQDTQLELTTFLTWTGYYVGIPVNIDDYQASNAEIYYTEDPAEQIFNTVQTYNTSTARAGQVNIRFNSEDFNQQLGYNTESFSCSHATCYDVNVTVHNGRAVTNYGEVQQKHKRPKAVKGRRDFGQSDWWSDWEVFSQVVLEEDKKKNEGGGISFFKILLGAGALYLAFKCFSWLRSCWNEDLNENTLKMIPQTSLWRGIPLGSDSISYRHTHIMMDYVY
ncbi:uncharacterized protein ABDE67_020905 [Symphorus nematophorus]